MDSDIREQRTPSYDLIFYDSAFDGKGGKNRRQVDRYNDFARNLLIQQAIEVGQCT